ncbi:MAG: helix-turn-helix domain-containing protein, partial [Steroidobacteraceae bacterium]
MEIDKDVVRRVLAKRYGPGYPGVSGPSRLTLFAQAKDSLWSVDLFRCESILLRNHWVIVVIDVFSRRIIGFGIGGGYIDGPHLCRMFNQAIAGKKPPTRIITDHD